MTKEFLGIIAIALSVIAFIPYITSILNGKTKPHTFSWIIWGSSTFIVFFAQFSAQGGAGSWSTGVSGCLALSVAILAFQRRADFTITRLDWCFFFLAMPAIPVWYMTNDPLWAVVILTTVDLLGFGPTFRKAFHHPFEENLTFYYVITLKNITALYALEAYSVTTMLFPFATTVAGVIFIIMVSCLKQKNIPN